MAGNKISSKQIVSKDVLGQLYKSSEYFADDADNIELDNLLRSINSSTTPPLRMSESSTPDLVVQIENITVTNPETDIRSTITPIDDVLPSFSSGTVTFPGTSGGNATPSAGSDLAISIASGNFKKIGINIDNTGDLVLVAGTEGATEPAAGTPALVADTFPLGYVVLENVGGTIQNITNNRIVQYVAGGSAGGGLATIPNTLYSAVSTNTTITDVDNIRTIDVTTAASTITITLPLAANNTNRIITIRKADSGTGAVLIDGTGSEEINGILDYTLAAIDQTVTLVCDGTGWKTLSSDIYYPTAMTNAHAARLGYKKYAVGTDTPAITGPAGFTLIDGVFIPYQMQDGTWRLKFNIVYSITSSTISDMTFPVSFAQVSALTVINYSASASANAARTTAGSSVIARSSTSGSSWALSGDAELSAKPAWTD